MTKRRSEIAMTDDEVGAYLREAMTLNIATVGSTGRPHLVAMWFAFVDDHIVFWTYGKSQKIHNLRRDPRITCLVESGTSYGELRGVELVGSARLVDETDRVLQIGRAVAVRYNGEAAVAEAAMPFLEAQARKRVGVIVDVEQVVSWDHRKLTGGY